MSAPSLKAVIIVHDLEQAKAALALLTDTSKNAALQTPPHAMAALGALYLKSMHELAYGEYSPHPTPFIIDCGASYAHAIIALREEHKHIRIDTKDWPQENIASLTTHAEALGATLHIHPPMHIFDAHYADIQRFRTLLQEW